MLSYRLHDKRHMIMKSITELSWTICKYHDEGGSVATITASVHILTSLGNKIPLKHSTGTGNYLNQESTVDQ